jgi:ribosome-associated toxin RatA of RatAB toxin-antitoxin module
LHKINNMGSLLKTSIALFLLFIVAILFIGYFLPKNDSVDVTKTISCPPNQVYTMVNNLKNWEKWSPWMEKDPTMKLSYNDSTSNAGAYYTWAGNSDVGFGKLAIVSNTENQQINMMLNYADHDAAACAFNIEPNESGSKIVWSVVADYPKNWFVKNFLGGYMYMMMNHFMQKDFGRGIENIEKNCSK